MFKPAHARSPKLNLVRMRQDFNRKQTEKSDYTRLIEPLAWSVGVSGFGLKSCRFGVARLPEDSPKPVAMTVFSTASSGTSGAKAGFGFRFRLMVQDKGEPCDASSTCDRERERGFRVQGLELLLHRASGTMSQDLKPQTRTP